MQTKFCSKCKIEKEESEFGKDSFQLSGLRPDCKDCRRKVTQLYYQQKQEEINKQHQGYYQKNREKVLLKQKLDPNKRKREKIYNLEHREEINKKTNERRAFRFATEPEYKLKHILRSRLKNVLKGVGIKSKRTLELLGCTVEHLRKHLESKFQDGMSWENHSFKGWHIDHIIPCAAFDLTDPKQQEQCFHYTNLQPLWANENFKKTDNYKEI
jgi:hypothetical protein